MENITDHKPGRHMKALLDIILNVVIIIVLVFVVRTYIVAPFQVFGPSMCNTLNSINDNCERGFGEYLIVNKIGYHVGLPDRGDIVVFEPSKDKSEFYIKRVIGIPGDTVKIQSGNVFLMRDGEDEFFPLEESYLSEKNAGRTYPFPAGITREYEVPDNSYFLLGDNRNESTDSRSCFAAPLARECSGDAHFLPFEQIEGKAWVVLWPLKNIRVLP